jgi:F-type H+-transporting ATPase subunit alpha
MKQVAGMLRLALAQYRELAAFAQFGSDLDKVTQQQLNRGARLTEILKQPPFSPLPVEKQVLIIYAGNNGYLDDVAIEHVQKFEEELYKFMEAKHPNILPEIKEKKKIDDDLKGKIDKALEEFKKVFKP